jgi:hypothetical protein
VHGVVLEQVGIGVNVAEVVDRHHVDAGEGRLHLVPRRLDVLRTRDVEPHERLPQRIGAVGSLRGTEEVPSDAAESIDGYLHQHS